MGRIRGSLSLSNPTWQKKWRKAESEGVRRSCRPSASVSAVQALTPS